MFFFSPSSRRNTTCRVAFAVIKVSFVAFFLLYAYYVFSVPSNYLSSRKSAVVNKNLNDYENYTSFHFDSIIKSNDTFKSEYTEEQKNSSPNLNPSPYTNPNPVISSNDIFNASFPCNYRWVNDIYKHYQLHSNKSLSMDFNSSVVDAIYSVCNASSSKNYEIKNKTEDIQIDDNLNNNGSFPEKICGQDYTTSVTFNSVQEYLHGRKFVFIVDVVEQLTKAKGHLVEVVTLAKLFNRTLILPMVGNSQIGMSQPLNFCAYFETQVLGNYVDLISEKYFLKLIFENNVNISSAFVCVTFPNPLSCFSKSIELAEMVRLFAISNGKYPQMNSSHTFLAGGYDGASHDGKIWRSMNRMIKEEKNILHAFLSSNDADVILYSKSTFRPSLRANTTVSAIPHLQYASYIHEKANKLIQDFLPEQFIAIHFRFEYIAAFQVKDHGEQLKSRMELCTSAAVRLVNYMSRTYNLRKIFIAADVAESEPPDSSADLRNLARSVSKTYMQEDNRPLYYAIRSLRTFRKSLNSIMLAEMDPIMNNRDSGVHSLVDKFICVNSAVFLHGNLACGGYGSFQKEISSFRSKTRNALNFKFGPE